MAHEALARNEKEAAQLICRSGLFAQHFGITLLFRDKRLQARQTLLEFFVLFLQRLDLLLLLDHFLLCGAVGGAVGCSEQPRAVDANQRIATACSRRTIDACDIGGGAGDIARRACVSSDASDVAAG